MLALLFRFVALVLLLTGPFYVFNLTQGMDPVESLRGLPSAYEQAFESIGEAIEERMTTPRPSGRDGTTPASPGTPVTPVDTGERPDQNEGSGEIAGLEDGIAQIPLIEQLVHDFTNERRQEAGVSVLSVDQDLGDVARAHSEDMGRNDYFAHENLEGQSPSDRADAAGYRCAKFFGLFSTGVGENLFQGWLFSSFRQRGQSITYDYMTAEEIAALAVESLMNSPGHRENMLSPHYDRLGVGVAVSEDQKVYVTQNFC